MLVCVDGTGVTSISAYRRDFLVSFVNRIKNEYVSIHPAPDPRPIHHRGPGTDAAGGSFGGVRHVDPEFVVEEVLIAREHLAEAVDAIPSWAGRRDVSSWAPEEVEQLRLINEGRNLFMTGYSRGGAIVIDTARLLARHNIQIEAMFLFDAVDRNPFLVGGEIPSNVRYCYHAMRDPASASRESFGNCGTTAAAGVLLKTQYFMTTHGGMGGVLWGDDAELDGEGNIVEDIDGSSLITPDQERSGSLRVIRWMRPWLRRHGVVA
jgi:hypothetical protein